MFKERSMKRICLDIGCGLKKKEGCIGIDLIKTESVDIIAVAENLPFKDNSVDAIYTRHTLEHVSDFEKAIKEIWRVSKPGAVIEIIVPFWAHHSANHPLHKRFFNRFSFDDYSIQKKDKTFVVDTKVKFFIEEIKYAFQIKRFPFSIFYKILEKMANLYYNTYESTFANIFPAYEIYFRQRVIK
jgi:ubiquinone/menaquinone biosynthesis C-methylase UbiE